jgi:hypothetical protein
MPQDEKPANSETEAPFDERPAEDVTNDSLGTVDPADSSGLDFDDSDRVDKSADEGIERPGKN